VDQKFEDAACAYAAGKIGFEQFAAQTQKTRSQWVGSMRRKLNPIPTWHAQEDSEQDFLLAIWQQRDVPEGYAPGTYFRLGLRRTDKKVQKARGVEQHRRRGKPQYERVFSSFSTDGAEDQEHPAFSVPVEETQEREAARTEYYEILHQLCETRMQRAAITALENTGGGLSAAAAYLFADRESCLVCKLDSEEHAARIILRVVDELVKMYGNEETKEAR